MPNLARPVGSVGSLGIEEPVTVYIVEIAKKKLSCSAQYQYCTNLQAPSRRRQRSLANTIKLKLKR